MQIVNRILRSAVFVISGFLMITAFPLAVWLLFNSYTTQGFLLAILGIMGPTWGLWLTFGRNRPKYTQTATVWGVGIGLLGTVLLFMAPSGRSNSEDPLRHMYSNDGRFIRLSPFNIIPEIEQMNVGTNLIGPADPLIDQAKADRLADLTLNIYSEMQEDPAFHKVGSVMGLPIRQPLQVPFDNGHYYLYVPESADKSEPMPVLVFLHGAGGPFKAY
ncbi:MAG: hypothetical protein AAF902_08500, partial [Chloroflexota bacterium]